jgi:competence protein ComEA
MQRVQLTSQQLDGLAVLVALATFFTVINIFVPHGGSSATPAEPFSRREKGMLAIALNVDEEERGVYFLPPEARTASFLPARGTAIGKEFEGGLDSRRLQTGDKVYLTSVGSSPPAIGRMTAAQLLALNLPIDINEASFEDLVLVPGIGERTAEQIIALRRTKGSFRSREELKEIAGIKEKRFDTLKKYFLALP